MTTVKGFADRGNYDESLKLYPATPKYFAGHGQKTFLFLIDLFKILFVAPRSHEVSQVVQLNRKSEEDQGFYHLFIHQYDEFFLVRYESGVCKIRYDGLLVWHKGLTWDDLFLRAENDTLIYSKEWRIDLTDGRILFR